MIEKREKNVSGLSRENPWDGKYCARTKARPVSFNITIFFITLIISLLILVSYSHSQTPVAPETKPASKLAPVEIVHNIKANRIARDYLELMEQLAGITKDYRDCYRLFETVAAKENLIELKALLTQLKKNSTLQRPVYLSKHLKEFARKLELQEEKLRLSQSEKRLQSTTRYLSQEITIIYELLNSEVIVRMDEEELKHDELQFLIARQEYDDLSKEVELILINGDNGEYTVTVQEIITSSDDVPEIPDIPDVPTLANPPAVPPLPRMPGSNFIYDSDRGRIHLTREFTDSIVNLPKHVAIEIINPVGQVDISGWPYNKVLVSYKVEFSLPDKNIANKLAEKVNLSFSLDKNRVHLESHLPNLSDIHSRVISARLSVKVPNSIAVIGETAFGRVSIENITNSVKISSNNCNLSLNNIDGTTEIISKLGTTDLHNVSGDILIKSLMGPVTIERSDGKFTIENSLESIVLSFSQGEVYIKNSGHVLVESHRGNVTIKNSNGEVEVRDLDGDLIAHNTYKPMLIESVSGSTEIYNLYAAIDALEIDGNLTIDNKFGDITVTDPRGAIFLSNQNGIINVNLADQLIKGSTIFAAFGEINLTIAESSNIDLVVTTMYGQILNYLPVDIVESGNNQSVRYVFGRGGTPLRVTGKHTEITISDSF